MSVAFAVQGIAKNTVFSARRTDRAMNADNIAVSFGNANVAAGQVKNMTDGIDVLAKGSKNGLFSTFKGAKDAIVSASEGSKLMKGIGSVISFVADHINLVITLVGAIKVLLADNKEEELTAEALALLGMFGCEGLTKEVLMMEKKIKDPKTGKKIIVKRTALYDNNPEMKKQAVELEEKIRKYFADKKILNVSMKHAPNIIKALVFVGASIGGYALGHSLGEKINENRRMNKAEKIALNENKANETKTIISRRAA